MRDVAKEIAGVFAVISSNLHLDKELIKLKRAFYNIAGIFHNFLLVTVAAV